MPKIDNDPAGTCAAFIPRFEELQRRVPLNLIKHWIVKLPQHLYFLDDREPELREKKLKHVAWPLLRFSSRSLEGEELHVTAPQKRLDPILQLCHEAGLAVPDDRLPREPILRFDGPFEIQPGRATAIERWLRFVFQQVSKSTGGVSHRMAKVAGRNEWAAVASLMPDLITGSLMAIHWATRNPVPANGVATESGSLDPVSAACGLVVRHPDWSNSKIAKQVGVHRSTLSRRPEYQRARQASLNAPPPHGSKNGKTRIVEASDD